MAVHAGRHQLGADRGRIVLHTFRDGLAAQAGHDLTPADLEVRVDMGALVVREGTGGLKPLTDRDRREIAVTARKVLRADRHQQASFAAARFEAAPDGGAAITITGTLTLAGASRPLRLRVTRTGPDAYRATGSVVQSEHGIRPYTGFLGALRVRDAVDIEVDVDLSEPASATGAEP